MQDYTEKAFLFSEENVNSTVVVKINVEQITGKKSGY